MQENTESEKPESSKVPEEAETSSEETPENDPIKSSDIETEFEEHEGEVLPPEKEKNKGCGFFILIILLLTSGSGYLYYTDQVPKTVAQWIEPLLNKLNPTLTKITPQFPNTEKSVPVVEEQIPTQAIEEDQPISEKETVAEIATSLSKDKTEEHISGLRSETSTDVIRPDHISNISGTTTEVDHAKMEQEKNTEKPEELKGTPVKEPAPAVITPGKPTRDIEKSSKKNFEEPVQQKEKERNKAVQAYLDFFEASLLKLGELVKIGFVKGKVLLEHILNKN